MKIRIALGLGVVGIALAVLLTLPTAQGSILGSKHDFSGDYGTSEICITCHTPHDAETAVGYAPLWNHEITAAVFTLYSTSTLDAVDLSQPGGASKLCLSCHDGTVAIDSFGGATGTDFIGGGDELIGTDLSGHHPISFTYDSSLATTDGELFDPSTTSSGLGSTIDLDMLFEGKVECSSCHDVHNTEAVAGTDLLRITNAASALCLTCHDK